MDIISTAEKQADLADSVVARTHEVYGYDTNIANYEAILATLPDGDWPDEIAAFRGMNDHEAAFACPSDLIDTLSQYQLRDRVSNLIKSERVERTKAAAILAVADASLTGPGRDAAIQAAMDRREAQLKG